MHPLWRDRDVIAGLIFLAVAVVFLNASLGLQQGRAVEMGPGYLPTLVSGLLLILAVVLIGNAIRVRSATFDGLELKEIGLVAAAIVLFGLLIRPAGLITATSAVVVSSFAASDVRWKEVILLCIGLCVSTVIVFIKLLKLPLAL
jgi:Tripartite tricarboxylate transporter TctB family